MARPPRKRKPANPNYEHTTLSGAGFWILPELLTCEGVHRGRWINQLVIQASTYEGHRLAIPLLTPALRSLAVGPAVAVEFEKPTPVKQMLLSVRGKTMEAPVLQEFVCFRVAGPDVWMPEFLTEKKDQHVLVSFSFVAYRQLLNHLKAISTNR